jgi:ppGpp synthetase/RelA/SpoT-type nucleotidyltranferase
MPELRTVEDYLRSEYVRLIPAMQRTLLAAETEVRHLLLDQMLRLDRYEHITITSRVKECESAIDALRRRQPFGVFDDTRESQYSLTVLPDLVGIRVLTFPQRRLEDARLALAPRMTGWVADHVSGTNPDAGLSR